MYVSIHDENVLCVLHQYWNGTKWSQTVYNICIDVFFFFMERNNIVSVHIKFWKTVKNSFIQYTVLCAVHSHSYTFQKMEMVKRKEKLNTYFCTLMWMRASVCFCVCLCGRENIGCFLSQTYKIVNALLQCVLG